MVATRSLFCPSQQCHSRRRRRRRTGHQPVSSPNPACNNPSGESVSSLHAKKEIVTATPLSAHPGDSVAAKDSNHVDSPSHSETEESF